MVGGVADIGLDRLVGRHEGALEIGVVDQSLWLVDLLGDQ